MKDGSQSLIQIYSHLPEIPQEENAAESWESLEGVCWNSLPAMLVLLVLASITESHLFFICRI